MAGGVSGLPGKPLRGDITEKTAGRRDFLRMHIPEGFAAAAWRKRYVRAHGGGIPGMRGGGS